jgi:hypothetical protein
MKKLIGKISAIYPSFKKVKSIFVGEKQCSDIPFYFIYAIASLLLTIFYIGLAAMFLLLIASAGGSSSRKRYPKDKYRKVVKEGLFYDSCEYHER